MQLAGGCSSHPASGALLVREDPAGSARLAEFVAVHLALKEAKKRAFHRATLSKTLELLLTWPCSLVWPMAEGWFSHGSQGHLGLQILRKELGECLALNTDAHYSTAGANFNKTADPLDQPSSPPQVEASGY